MAEHSRRSPNPKLPYPKITSLPSKSSSHHITLDTLFITFDRSTAKIVGKKNRNWELKELLGDGFSAGGLARVFVRKTVVDDDSGSDGVGGEGGVCEECKLYAYCNMFRELKMKKKVKKFNLGFN